jgi:hypothetical protein
MFFLIWIPFLSFPLLISQIVFFFYSPDNKTIENIVYISANSTISGFWGSFFATITHFVLYLTFFGIRANYYLFMFLFFNLYVVLLSSISGGIAGCIIEKSKLNSK